MARNFSTTSNRIEFASDSSWNNLDELTVCVWMRRTTNVQSQRMVDKNSDWLMQEANSTSDPTLTHYAFSPQRWPGATRGKQQWTKPPTGEWHHECVSYSYLTDSFAAYRDAVAQTTITAAASGTKTTTGTTSIAWGGRSAGTAGWTGDLWQGAIWNRVLTAAEVAIVYSEGPLSVPNGLVNYAPLEGETAEPNVVGVGGVATITGTARTGNPPARIEMGLSGLDMDDLPAPASPSGATLTATAAPATASLTLATQESATIAATAAPGTTKGPTPTGTGTVTKVTWTPPTLGYAVDFYVYTPPGYDPAGSRSYPVLYMADGDVLFTALNSARTTLWGLDGVLDTTITAGKCEPVIVVGLGTTTGLRSAEYFDATPTMMAPLVSDIKPHFDGLYRTKTGFADTGVGGFSLGADFATRTAGTYTTTFGRVFCYSHNVKGPHGELLTAIQAGLVLTKYWMSRGTLEGDATDRANDADMVAKLKSYGWVPGRDFLYTDFPGESHSETSCGNESDEALIFAYPTEGLLMGTEMPMMLGATAAPATGSLTMGAQNSLILGATAAPATAAITFGLTLTGTIAATATPGTAAVTGGTTTAATLTGLAAPGTASLTLELAIDGTLGATAAPATAHLDFGNVASMTVTATASAATGAFLLASELPGTLGATGAAGTAAFTFGEALSFTFAATAAPATADVLLTLTGPAGGPAQIRATLIVRPAVFGLLSARPAVSGLLSTRPDVAGLLTVTY